MTEYDTEGRPVSVLAWEPHGKLVGVIPNVHNGGVQCLEFYPLTNRLMSGGRDSRLSDYFACAFGSISILLYEPNFRRDERVVCVVRVVRVVKEIRHFLLFSYHNLRT